MKPIVSMKFLGDEETVKKAIESVAAQGKAKKEEKKTYKIVMVRHGESAWNKENRFCGWVDAALSEKGVQEAKAGGKALRKAGYKFDLAHTSVLQRAQTTLKNVLHEIGQDHPFYDTLTKDPRYKDGPSKDEFPMYESLKLTIGRTLPYWDNIIVPQIKEGKKIIIAAHGNSLRGIVKHLDNMTDDEIMGLNLPTGIPFVYELDENLKPIVSMKFLGDEETVKKAIASVAAQGKSKKVEATRDEPMSMVAHQIQNSTAHCNNASMLAHTAPSTESWLQPVLDSDCVRKLMEKPKTYKIVMVRHGESTWNLENRFCG